MSQENFVKLISISIELGLEYCDFLPDVEICNKINSLFYEQVLFLNSYWSEEFITDELTEELIKSYSERINQIKEKRKI